MIGRRTLTLAIAVAIVLTLALPAWADAADAVAWLKMQQNADGGFGDPESTVGTTADVILAVAATGADPLSWSQAGNTPYTYLAANASAISGVGDMGKAILALIAAGKNPRQLDGADLVQRLEATLGGDGAYGESGMVNDQAYAMLALASARRPIPDAAINYLLARQIEDGTWAWNGDTTAGAGDNNTAAFAVLALLAAGVPADHPQVEQTFAHFRGQQNEDGGFPYISPSPYGTDSDANSTAVVMWAITAAGEDPAGDAWKYQGQDGASPLDRLRAFQNESGAFRWQDAVPADNMLATVQAPIALELKTVPYAYMDVGEAASTAPGTETEVAAALPETGGSAWHAALALLAVGVALFGVGKAVKTPRVRGRYASDENP
jgi:hypothetical protein